MITPTLLPDYRDRFSDFQLVTVDGVGHWIVEERPELVLDRLRESRGVSRIGLQIRREDGCSLLNPRGVLIPRGVRLRRNVRRMLGGGHRQHEVVESSIDATPFDEPPRLPRPRPGSYALATITTNRMIKAERPM